MTAFILKTILMTIIIAAAGYTGNTFACRYTRRLKELEALKKSMLMLNGQITYAGNPLEECFAELALRCSEDTVGLLFADAAAKLSCSDGRSAGGIWEECVKLHEWQMALNSEDLRELTALGNSLGFLNAKLQTDTIAFYMTALDAAIADARAQLEGKCKTARTLCLAAGIFLCILLA